MYIDRRALIVGINNYQFASQLSCSLNDAEAVGKLLETNVDGTPNYTCRVLLDKMEDGKKITRAELRGACEELFANYRGDVLFYFSGHGVLTQFGGHLCAYDSQKNDWGLP